MRSRTVLLLVTAMAVLVACGCSRKTTTVVPGARKVTVEEKGKGEGKVTVKSKEGEMTMEMGKKATVTEAELGVPIYPGAEQGESGTWSMTGKEGSGSTAVYQFKTKDPYDKVFAFYKDKIKNPTSTIENTSDGKKLGLIQVVDEGKKLMIHVTVQEKDGQTEIGVQKMKQSG
jgi:hypothetical protein